MYIVAILSADGETAETPKFFEHLPDARAYAHRQVQFAQEAKIYDAIGVTKPSLDDAYASVLFDQPIEIIGRRATKKEIVDHELAWLRKRGYGA